MLRDLRPYRASRQTTKKLARQRAPSGSLLLSLVVAMEEGNTDWSGFGGNRFLNFFTQNDAVFVSRNGVVLIVVNGCCKGCCKRSITAPKMLILLNILGSF